MNEKFRLIVRDEPVETGRRRHRRMDLRPALADALLIAVILVLFAWWHHGATEYGGRGILVSPRSGPACAMTEDFKTADNGGEAGHFEFYGRFRHEEPVTVQDGATTYYYDSGAEISFTGYQLASGIIRVADVYIADISRLTTALANDFYGKGQREEPALLSSRHDALFSITGDNYSERYGGAVMRNGVLYSREAYGDVCVLCWDGMVYMYPEDEFDLAHAVETGACQIWSRGPILLEDGRVTESALKDESIPNRRVAMGYFEPGHYCFVIMEGNVSLEELALNMQALGCRSAYNLYGGSVAEMNFDGQVISSAREVNRKCGDIIMLTK